MVLALCPRHPFQHIPLQGFGRGIQATIVQVAGPTGKGKSIGEVLHLGLCRAQAGQVQQMGDQAIGHTVDSLFRHALNCGVQEGEHPFTGLAPGVQVPRSLLGEPVHHIAALGLGLDDRQLGQGIQALLGLLPGLLGLNVFCAISQNQVQDFPVDPLRVQVGQVDQGLLGPGVGVFLLGQGQGRGHRGLLLGLGGLRLVHHPGQIPGQVPQGPLARQHAHDLQGQGQEPHPGAHPKAHLHLLPVQVCQVPAGIGQEDVQGLLLAGQAHLHLWQGYVPPPGGDHQVRVSEGKV